MPWSIEEHNDASFIVRDHSGQALAYVYFEEEPGQHAGRTCSRATRRRIAAISESCRSWLAILYAARFSNVVSWLGTASLC